MGRGVVAWAAAAGFAARLRGVEVTVIEDVAAPPSLADLVGTATPSIVDFHHDLRIDERSLMRGVDSVFRLGTRFTGWNTGLPPYLHTYGEHGEVIAGASFHHHWLRLRAEAGGFEQYSPGSMLARAGRFVHPEDDGASPLAHFGYGLHLNPAQYAAWLRGYALHLGATACQGPGVPQLDPATGRVEALMLPDGRRIVADLYVDTGGALADAVDPRRTDWSHWLPASHLALARAPAPPDPLLAEEVEATPTGWRMRAPLRSANVEVTVSTEAVAEPCHRFAQGCRAAPWRGNVVALGDAALVLEPLEGTALHIAHAQIDRIVDTLPGTNFAQVETADYNRQTLEEATRLRDFLILHYVTADRPEPLWRDLAATEPPAALADDLRRFRARGHLALHDGESFAPDSWLSVLIGQGVFPRRVDPVADELPRAAALARLATIRQNIARAVAPLPTHREYLAHYLKAGA